MAKKDYSMAFKNRDIDRFSNKFGKSDGGDEPKKMKVTPENNDKVRQGNIDRLNKKLSEMDKKAQKNLVTDLPAFKEQRKKITDEIAVLKSRMGK